MSLTPSDAAISARVLTRIIILLIAAWSLVCAAVLIGFHGATAGALGAGVEDEAGQRLLGAHLLILVPAYLLLAWRPERYQTFLWLPLASQAATAFAVTYSILTGETSFGDGVLAAAVSSIFVVLLGFVWVSEQRTVARAKLDADQAESAPADATPFREP
ncbi:MAG: hypothetical protein GEU75_04595 [Dehalococcoidia bacterium]|nr:hypothetical protein [Dehalococcoidia bacterium]